MLKTVLILPFSRTASGCFHLPSSVFLDLVNSIGAYQPVNLIHLYVSGSLRTRPSIRNAILTVRDTPCREVFLGLLLLALKTTKNPTFGDSRETLALNQKSLVAIISLFACKTLSLNSNNIKCNSLATHIMKLQEFCN